MKLKLKLTLEIGVNCVKTLMDSTVVEVEAAERGEVHIFSKWQQVCVVREA